MEYFDTVRIKWTYATHMVDRKAAAQVIPVPRDADHGTVILGRVVSIGKHKDVEGIFGQKQVLFPGDIVAGVLGHRYATDQYHGRAAASGALGHLLSVGGVCGEVIGKNEKMLDPTVLEWIGCPADSKGQPLNLRRFVLRPASAGQAVRPFTLLVVGAAMNSGKTTTAAQAIRSLSGQGRRVSAAKLTGTACRKDPGMMEDGGAIRVLDFTHAGHPSTAYLPESELLRVAAILRSVLLDDEPEFLVYEIADGILQRETRILLEDPGFRSVIDAVVYAAPESPSCEAGVRRLREWRYNVVATAGLVANSPLGIAESEEATGVKCLNGEMILSGALDKALQRVSVA